MVYNQAMKKSPKKNIKDQEPRRYASIKIYEESHEKLRERAYKTRRPIIEIVKELTDTLK